MLKCHDGRRLTALVARRYKCASLQKVYLSSNAGDGIDYRKISRLILLRHGQSIWNKTPTFSGWTDIALTSRGREQAREAGELFKLRGLSHLTIAFTSELERAWETCEIVCKVVAEGSRRVPIVRDWRLNERHYGALQGIPKHDQGIFSRYGEEHIYNIRRSLDARPPPLEPAPSFGPATESLADCRIRVLEAFHQLIKPALFSSSQQGSLVLLVAHSNTLRALISHLDEVDDDLVPGLHVPNSVPIIYDFDLHTQQPVAPMLDSDAQGRGGSHARWLLSEQNQSKILKALRPGGLLTRALFESWDLDHSGCLSTTELAQGLKQVESDIALSAIARRIVRRVEHDFEGNVSLDQWDRLSAEVIAEFRLIEENNEKTARGEAIINDTVAAAAAVQSSPSKPTILGRK